MTLVQIVHPHDDFVPYSFHHSMMRLTHSEFDNYKLTNFNFSGRATTLGLVEARNELMRMVLDETSATHVFLIDTDMGFAADTVSKLVATGLDVVGGLCFGLGMLSPDDLGGYITKPFATVYDYIQNEDDGNIYFVAKDDLDLDSESIQQVAATGAACLLVSRFAAESVRKEFGDVWFDQVMYPGTKQKVSEDLSFCYRLGAVGIKIYVHTGVRTNHAKTIWVSGVEI